MYRRILGIVAAAILTGTAMTQPASADHQPDPEVAEAQSEYAAPAFAANLELPRNFTAEERRIIRQAPAIYGARCYTRWTTDSGRMTFNHDRWVDVSNRVVFRQCRYNEGRGTRFVDPLSFTFAYNVEGSEMRCGWPNAFDQINFHIYLWDGAGRNYDKAGMLGCHTDTTDSTTRSLLEAPRMTYCQGFPKWRLVAEGVFRFQENDEVTLSNVIWDPLLQGPFPSTC